MSWGIFTWGGATWGQQPTRAVDRGGDGYLLDDSGSYAFDSYGHIMRDPTVATRCRIRLRTRRGEWIFDPTLGSRLHTIQTTKGASGKARQYIREALKPLLDEGAILAIDVGDVETSDSAGLLAVRVAVTVPGEGVQSLGLIPLGAS